MDYLFKRRGSFDGAEGMLRRILPHYNHTQVHHFIVRHRDRWEHMDLEVTGTAFRDEMRGRGLID
jgi:hypothetical protein